MVSGPNVSNDEVYASGLLTRALDPATQPSEIRAFLQAEFDLLGHLVTERTSWLDVGCGTGRHLALFADRVRLGAGIDYERAYLVAARQRAGDGHLHFVAGDASRLPLRASFDLATCLTNTWGTMSSKEAVLAEMRRCAPRPSTRLLSVFAQSSIPARREWYRRFGHPVVEESEEWLMTAGGLRSEHFSEARLRSLIGDCRVTPCTSIGYIVQF